MYRFNGFNAQLKSLCLLVLLGLALVFGGPIGGRCSDEPFESAGAIIDAVMKGCSAFYGYGIDTALKPGVAANPQQINVTLDIGLTGVFTPTTTSGGVKLAASNGVLALDDLAAKGYVAVRVPHAPPTYTASSLLPGIAGPNAVEFSYYLPPTATLRTTVPVTVVRRVDLESTVNSRWPIADGRSHWEVWWLPSGDQFPIPEQPFQLKDGWPQPIEIMFRIDFGAGAASCAGCPIEVVTYNGYVFIGPYTTPIVLEDTPSPVGNPLVGFGARCGSPSLVQEITSTVPFTQTHWLESYDTVARTFTINAASSRGWAYTYYYQLAPATPPEAVAGPPFNIPLGPKPDDWPWAACAQIMAVYTPTLAANDAVRETFNITATSTVSPSVRASSVSFTLGPAYTLDEGTLASVSYTLTITKAGIGSGTVIKSPDQISYTAGSAVSLTATADAGSTFAGWSGDAGGAISPVTVTMTTNKTVTATFNLSPIAYYTLTVATTGTGNGTVIKSPDQISYTAGSAVSLTAIADAGSTFAGWSGDAGGAISPVTVTLNANKSVTATFNRAGGCDPIGGLGFTYTPIAPRVGQSVSFTATITSGTLPVTYTWSWGDATAADTGAFVHHAFPLVNTPTTYTVMLTAANVCGTAAPVEKTVTVQPHRLYLPLVVKLN